MEEERNFLVKTTFPQLRRRCRERDMEFTELDLRWGVTEEEARQGKVIGICLREIDRCRPSIPFFIGILGERYGWIPFPAALEKHKLVLEEFPWVEADLQEELSITEIEIQYAVLRNPVMEGKAFFFLRKIEASSEEYRETEKSPAAEKLKKLKTLLRSRKDFAVYEFGSNEDLGNQVEEELWKVIEQHFPAAEEDDSISRTRKEHASFARSRTTLYIGGEKYYPKLDAHYETANQPIVITGAGGMGKSALLANWLEQFKKQHPETFILPHFIGGAPDSTDYVQLMRRLMEAMKKEFGITDEVPFEPDKLKDALPLFFAQSSTKGKWVLVLEALNQLEDRDNAKLLNWLPSFIPPFVRVYLSVAIGTTLVILQKRNLETIIIEPLNFSERVELISSYLGKYSKKLSEETLYRIANDRGSKNPLILRTLLDELRIFGRHEDLEKRIDYYISKDSTEAFFDRVLERMELDYEGYRTGMVEEILSLVFCARKGITEKELLDITGIPPLHWSPLFIALENHLISHSGLLNISHDYLKQTIRIRYLNSETKERQVHQILATYFHLDMYSSRALDEIPWQYIQAEKKVELKNYLVDIEVFNLLFEKDRYALLAFWKYLENDFIPDQEYDYSVYNAEKIRALKNVRTFANLSFFFTLLGKVQKALDYSLRVVKLLEKVFFVKDSDLALSYNNLGVCYSDLGEYAKALGYKLKAMAIQLKVLPSDHLDFSTTYSNIGVNYSYLHDYSKALEYHYKALTIREKLLPSQHLDLTLSYNNIANTYLQMGVFDKAVEFAIKAVTIREKVLPYYHPDLAASYNTIGMLCNELGDYNNALLYSFKSLDISEKILPPEHPEIATSYNNIGSLYGDLGEYDRSLEFYFKSLKINEKIHGSGDINTATALSNIAVVYSEKEDYDLSLEFHFKALAVKEKVFGIGNTSTAISYSNVGCVYEAKENYDLALEFHLRALKIQERVLGHGNIATATTYNNIGIVYSEKGEYKQALESYSKALQIQKQVLGLNHVLTSSTYCNIGMVYKKKRLYFLALDHFFKSIEIDKQVFGKDNIQTATTYLNIGSTYSNNREYDRALNFYFKALDLHEKLGDKNSPSAGTVLNDIGMCLFYKSNFTEALDYFMKAHVIRKFKLGTSHPETKHVCRWLSETFKEIGNDVEAQRWSNEA